MSQVRDDPTDRPSDSVLTIGGRRGGALIGGAAAVAALCSLGSQVLFERALGVEGFAQWAYLSALLTIFVPLACMGSWHILLSEVLEPEFSDRLGLWLLLIYFGSFTLLALAAFVTTLKVGAPSGLVTLPWMLLVTVFLAQIPIVLAFPVFQRRRHTAWVAGWPLLQVVFRLLVAIASLAVGWTVFGSMVAWAFSSCALAAVAVREVWPSVRIRPLRSRQSRDSPAASLERIPRLFVSGIGFGLSDLFGSLDLKLIVPLAAVLFTSTETAAAGLATVLLSAAHFFPNVLVTRVLLPAVHRESDTTRGALRSLVLRLSVISAGILVPLAAAFAWLGYPMLALIVRGDYSSQEQAIAWLGVCWIPMCISQLAAAPHIARRSTWRLFWWRVEALVLFILAALALSAFGLLAIVIGFTVGRTWLSMRVLWPLRVRPTTT